jgi:magnesium-transporting ATPase (P-type)
MVLIKNNRGTGGGLDMDVFWEIIISVTSIMLVILIPYAFYYYDTGEEKAVVSEIINKDLTLLETKINILSHIYCDIFHSVLHWFLHILLFPGRNIFPNAIANSGSKPPS